MPSFTEMGRRAQIYMHHDDSWSPWEEGTATYPGFLPGEP